MHGIYELKEMLCKELEEYGKKGELSAGTLEIVDKLAHAIKNIDKIIESYENEDYSGAYNYEDRSYRGSSYARGRGRGARRDSMGRYSSEGYSRAGEMAEQLRNLMHDAPNEHIRQKIQHLVSEVEMM